MLLSLISLLRYLRTRPYNYRSTSPAPLRVNMQTYLVSFIFSIFAAAFIFGRRRSRLPLPPGPKRLPWVGNLFNRPTVRTWLAFTDMKAQYGDIMSLEVFGQPFIVVNSAKVANELFEKRSSNYADRPGASCHCTTIPLISAPC